MSLVLHTLSEQLSQDRREEHTAFFARFCERVSVCVLASLDSSSESGKGQSNFRCTFCPLEGITSHAIRHFTDRGEKDWQSNERSLLRSREGDHNEYIYFPVIESTDETSRECVRDDVWTTHCTVRRQAAASSRCRSLFSPIPSKKSKVSSFLASIPEGGESKSRSRYTAKNETGGRNCDRRVQLMMMMVHPLIISEVKGKKRRKRRSRTRDVWSRHIHTFPSFRKKGEGDEGKGMAPNQLLINHL